MGGKILVLLTQFLIIFFLTKKMLNLAWNLLLTMVLLLYFLLLNSYCY